MGDTLTLSHLLVQVKIPGVAGVLEGDTCKGGNAPPSVSRRARPGAAFKRAALPGPGDLEDIEVTLQMDRDSAPAVAAYLRTRQGQIDGCEIIKIILGPDRRPDSRYAPIRSTAAKFMVIGEPEPDSDSNSLAMLTLTFAPSAPWT